MTFRVKVYSRAVSIVEWNMRKQMDKTRWEEEYITCSNCQKNIRPVERAVNGGEELVGNGFHMCPVCLSSVEKEMDRHKRKHDLGGSE